MVSQITTDTFKVTNALLDIIKTNKAENSHVMENASMLLTNIWSWIISLKNCCKSIDDDHLEAFPDLARPLKTSFSQLESCVLNLHDLVIELAAKVKCGLVVSKAGMDLVRYPDLMPDAGAKKEQLNKGLQPALKRLVEIGAVDSDRKLNVLQ